MLHWLMQWWTDELLSINTFDMIRSFNANIWSKCTENHTTTKNEFNIETDTDADTELVRMDRKWYVPREFSLE